MNLKRAIAAATAMAAKSSMCAMTAFAEGEWNTNGGKSEVTGESTAYQPTIEVELPGDLSFGINPLKLNVSEDPDSAVIDQIISGEFYVCNASNVPVAVRTTTYVVTSNDVDLKKTSDLGTAGNIWDGNKELKPSADKKAVWLTQLYPSKIESAEDGYTMTVENIKPGTSTAASVKGDTLAVSTDNAGAGITYQPIFVLGAYDEETPLASIGGFKFDGAVDPNASFVEEDITIKAVFELKALTTGQVSDMFEGYKAQNNTTAAFYTTVKKLKSGKTW